MHFPIAIWPFAGCESAAACHDGHKPPCMPFQVGILAQLVFRWRRLCATLQGFLFSALRNSLAQGVKSFANHLAQAL